MGYYVTHNSKGEVLPTDDKFWHLMMDGARVVKPTEWEENLVCIVQNDWGQAAAYCFDQREFIRFSRVREDDKRDKVWVVYEHAARLSGYNNRIKD